LRARRVAGQRIFWLLHIISLALALPWQLVRWTRGLSLQYVKARTAYPRPAAVHREKRREGRKPLNNSVATYCRNPMKKQAGFTLTEMMIVVVIMAILATIAVPSYREAVRKSDRRAAQSAMMEIASRERQVFVSERAFQDEDDLAFTLPAELEGKYTYTITVDNDATPPTFTINFTAIGAQAADGNLSLDSAGVKGPDAEKW
jgi:type IV pilus assembly protein PilE